MVHWHKYCDHFSIAAIIINHPTKYNIAAARLNYIISAMAPSGSPGAKLQDVQEVPTEPARPTMDETREMFRDKVDLSFTAGHTNHTKYRDLLLHKPTTSMSGTYTCKVSSLESEAVMEARMMVYSPATATEFRQKKVVVDNKKSVNISCSFEGLYPAPEVKLTWGSFELIEDAVMISPREGSYDVIIHKTLEHEELPAETVFGCEITIPGTEYFLREEAIYHHRGKRSSDMAKIAELERIRARKERTYLYNTDSRHNIELLDSNDLQSLYGAGIKNQSIGLIANIILVLCLVKIL